MYDGVMCGIVAVEMSDENSAGQPEDGDVQQAADEPTGETGTGDTEKRLKNNTGRKRPGRRAGKQQYNCTSCTRSFSTRQEIVTHQYMHRENPTVFCAVCNKSFGSESAYRRHAASHSRKMAKSAEPKPRKTCHQCDMQFDTMRQLSAHHAAKHVDEKRFVCAICGSQFAWPENLRAHQRTHELDPHECELCGRRFVDATSLRVHTRNSHGPSSDGSVPRKQHICKLCGRSFQFDFSLRAHMKGHAQSPAAINLRRSKTNPGSTLPNSIPRMQTKYVHVDSQGVIDLGMDVNQAAVNQPSEIIVEVYNYEPSTANDSFASSQTMDFSDVLDRSQVSDDQNLEEHETAASVANNSVQPKLVWYVKPDETQPEMGPGPDQKGQESGEIEVGGSGTADEPTEKVDEVLPPPVSPGPDVDNEDAAASEDGDENGDEGMKWQPPPKLSNELEPGPTDNVETDGDDDDDDDGEDIDWMESEPPPRRAAPFIFRSSTRPKRVTRPREPFLFNCVMTDEKPFVCTTCGQSFRWEISLNIHHRDHTDGTFPNKSRSPRDGTVPSSKGRGKSKKKKKPKLLYSPAKTPVARSCIVRHRRTSSDEEDDEFTFHVQADGPSEVSSFAVRGRGRGVVTVRKPPVLSPSSTVTRPKLEPPVGRCNGVGRQTAKVVRKPCGGRRQSVRPRAGLVCRRCHRVMTTGLAALVRHWRRSHHTASLVCQWCSARFTSSLDLRRHRDCVHANSSTAKCGRCGRVFADKTRLRRHSKLHSAVVKPASARL